MLSIWTQKACEKENKKTIEDEYAKYKNLHQKNNNNFKSTAIYSCVQLYKEN